jgi:hypothetical protein
MKYNKNFFYRYYDAEPPNCHRESYSKYRRRMKNELPPGVNYSCIAKPYEFYEKYDLAQHDLMSFYSPRTKNSPGFEYLNKEAYPIFYKKPRKSLSDEFKNDELVVKFNVLYPIDIQINKAMEEIGKQSKEVVVNPTRDQEYNDKPLLIKYLRLLDAAFKKATDEEILFYIYRHTFPYPESITSPDIIKERLSKLDGDEKRRIKKRFEENKTSAVELCNGGYVSIVKSASHYLNKSRDKKEAAINKEI